MLFLLIDFNSFSWYFNPWNPKGHIYTSMQICGGAHGTYIYIYIYVTMTFSGSRKKSDFQHPELTNKSVFHDVYIRPKSTELSFP